MNVKPKQAAAAPAETCAAALESAVREGLIAPGRALLLSAAMTDEALALGRLGFGVVLVDTDREALRHAAATARGGGVRVQALSGDFLLSRGYTYGPVSLVVERAFLPRLDPVRRADWAHAVGRTLPRDGRLFGWFPVGRATADPPHAVGVEELRGLLGRQFAVELLQPAGVDSGPGHERPWKGLFRRM